MKRVLLSLLLAGCAGLVVFWLPLGQTYPQLILGELSVLGGSKTNDMLVFPVAFVVFAGTYLFYDFLMRLAAQIGTRLGLKKYCTFCCSEKIQTVVARLPFRDFCAEQAQGRVGIAVRNIFNKMIQSESVTLLCILLSLYAGSVLDGQRILFLRFGLLVAVAAVLISWAARRVRVADVELDDVAPAFWGAWLFALFPFGVAVVVARMFSVETVLWEGVKANQLAEGALAVFSVVLIGCYAFTRIQARQLAVHALLIGQLGLPLLVWVFYPVAFATPDGLYRHDSSLLLPLFLAGFMVLSYGDLYKRWLQTRNGERILDALSPLCLAVGFGAVCVPIFYMPGLSGDDYHFGEKLLGFTVYAAGKLPYVDYFPPHGLVFDDMGLLFSHLFYDGTATLVELSNTLVVWLAFIVALLVSQHMTKNILLSLVVSVVALLSHFYIYLVPLLALMFSQPRPEERARFCFTWLCLALLTLLVIPPQGLVLVCASSLLPLCYFICAVRETPAAAARYAALGAALAALILLSPLGEMFLSIARYVLENGSTNQLAWGVPWRVSFQPFTLGGLLWQAISSLWFAVVLMFFLLLAHDRDYYFNKELRCLPLIAGILFCMLMIPYTMGRIDVGGFTRHYFFSAFAVGTLLPLGMQNSKKIYLTLALSAACLFIASRSPFPAQYDKFRVGVETIPYTLTNGADFGSPQMGTGVINPVHADLIRRVGAELAKHPEAPFYNATDLNALYYYTGRLPFVVTTAPLNSPTTQQQQRIVEQLRAHPTAIILLRVPEKPFMWELPIRTYNVYRYIVENYIPYESENLIWARPNTERRALTPEEFALYTKAFPIRDLGWTPAMWGASEKSLKRELVEVLDTEKHADMKGVRTANDIVTAYTYNLSSADLKGKDAGILRFELEKLPAGMQPRVQVFWWGDDMNGQEVIHSFAYKTDNGVQLVPLDVLPSYLLLNKIKQIRIDVEGVPDSKPFSLHGVKFLQRRSL